PASARRLYRLTRLLQPRIIVETGTFEGLGTYTLAKAASENGLPARIFTVDYDGDPEFDCPPSEWEALKTWRAQNLEKARADFPTITIHFVEGDSRRKLPEILESLAEPWDLFFQDSMHFTAGILAEWEIMKPRAAPGAVAVFDDVCLDWKKLPSHLAGRRDFCLGFVLREGLREGWRWRSTAEGRAQFFAQKKR
ncbi:MAG: class I SAM-dependent methyltransferase, partial [Terrimicrobiaceae bacterium]|nr:class I SAM-dependent methyltransferase [Terrimicrobiaceae bacterium]